ncbi:MAG: shikimate dehydrogenase [Rickettsiales bacterium]|nr:shikimate dehydrogenase [Rickettsiales bacterium]
MSTKKAGVIGDPISHSLSPTIHNFLLSKHKIAGEYSAILVKKDELKSFVNAAVENGLAGFNVTIPHKEEIFKICDHKSKTAALTGAVNTVVITPDKKIFGHNSDAEGFANHLKNSQPHFDLKDKTAFVIGAGGAARAIVYALIKGGAKKVYISNRSEIRAEELIKNFAAFCAEKKCELQFLHKKTFAQKLGECDLLVNSSSLGMTGQEPLEIDLENLKSDAIVFDIVYKPLMTELLKAAELRGNKIVTGLGMLVFQALIGFELWFGKKPDEKFVKELFEVL